MSEDFTPSLYWARAVTKLYGLSVDLEPLDGEYDLNFRAIANGAPIGILKIMRPGCDESLVDGQCKALDHIASCAEDFPTPKVIRTTDGALYRSYPDLDGTDRLVWILSHLNGVPYGSFSPPTPQLIRDLGRRIGEMGRFLATFDHPVLDRSMKWNLMEADWIGSHIGVIGDSDRRDIVVSIHKRFEHEVKPALAGFDSVPIHNDANDYNILVKQEPNGDTSISGLIDFGDMLRAPRVCELAIAGAYVVLDQEDPVAALATLVAGYHETNPLSEAELSLVYPLILTRLAVSVVNSTMMAIEKPDDPYVVISQASAWRFLDRSKAIDITGVEARLRVACGLPISPAASRVLEWLDRSRGGFEPIMGRDLSSVPRADLSVAGSTMPRNPLHLTEDEATAITGDSDEDYWEIGLYAEPRLIYAGEAFRAGPYEAGDRRSVHIGVDIFAPAGTPVAAPLEGTVHAVQNSPDRFDYGGVVILEHKTPTGDVFHTLYGHLDPEVVTDLTVGETVTGGAVFAKLGTQDGNGGWRPHLHFQLSVLASGDEIWPGVADPKELAFLCAAYPNPAALMNLSNPSVAYEPIAASEIKEYRQAHFAANLKLSYRNPCMFLRGWRHYLFDEMGRCYLDAYNNVPHVGHAHPRLQALAYEQLGRLNSNTRYLHPAQTDFAAKILSKLPEKYAVCFFVNSGSEANELALRLVRAATGGKDMIAPDHGYHGMTTGAIDISAYKFNKPNGVGQPNWVQLVSVPDPYRTPTTQTGLSLVDTLASEVDEAIGRINDRGGKLAGFIAETFPSVGGQIIPPDGYLKAVYERIRAAGGVCIADEVQTGLGRLGTHYWAFEILGVEPDIVVLGKPLGNGHPIGAVITTREIADAFANGIEYFSTFGGSTLSCRMGREVLQIVDDEGLQENARKVGRRLLDGFESLMTHHPVIGDVRGHGLFLGIEFVKDRVTKEPAGDIADYVVNRLRDHRILIGTEGPGENILKIRPPLTIRETDADMIVDCLDKVLNETFCVF